MKTLTVFVSFRRIRKIEKHDGRAKNSQHADDD